MAIANQHELLSRTNVEVFYSTQQTFHESYQQMRSRLNEWIDSLDSKRDSLELFKESDEIWEFRKLINVYIGILVQCVGSSELPECILCLSHSIGQIKDMLRNDQPMLSRDAQHWKNIAKSNLQESLIFDLQPLPEDGVSPHLSSLTKEIISLASKDSLSACEFHDLRKMIRTFKARYTMLINILSTNDRNSTLPQNSPEIIDICQQLEIICHDMGLVLDNTIKDVYFSYSPQNEEEFYSIFNSTLIQVSDKLREQIFETFINEKNIARV